MKNSLNFVNTCLRVVDTRRPGCAAAAQLTFVKLRLLSNLVCSFRNSEVLTGESPDMLTRSMLDPWHLLYSSRRDGSGSRDVGSDFHEALLEIRKGRCGDDARGL